MTQETLSLPALARDANAIAIEIKRDDTGPVRLTFPLSSEAPVERWFGTEILSHAPEAIRLDRIRTGAAPLLFNHDWGDPIGMIDGGRIENGRLVVDAHLFDTERAREVAAMIDGGLRNVSIGYEIHDMREEPRGTLTANSWEPLEGSIVTIPADVSVGIGRAHGHNEPKPVRVTRAHSTASAEQQEHSMSENTASAAESVEPKVEQQPAHVQITREAPKPPAIDAAKAENERIERIKAFGTANRIDQRQVDSWITSGADMASVGSDFLKILEARSQAASQPADVGLSKKEVRQYSLLRAINASRSNDWRKAGLELEASRAVSERAARDPRNPLSFFVPAEIQRRDLLATSTGSQLVMEDTLIGSFIELLRNQSAVLDMGATRLTGLTGNVKIPRQTGATTAYWIGTENTAITESTPSFGQITLQPKSVAALVEVSHQMLQQSAISVENLIVQDMARTIALAVDVAAIRGSGTNGEPHGIVGTTNVGSFDVDGTSTYSDVVAAQQDLMTANALNPGCAYLADPVSAALLMGRSRFANTDTPIWDGSLMGGTMAGFPCRASNQMSANTMLFGWWQSLIIAEWGVLEVAVDDTYNFAQGLSALRAWYTVDVGLRHPAAFTYDSSVA
jgi:HK97 family phage major capsid protein